MALELYLELQRQDRFEGCRTSQLCQGCAEASVCYVLLWEQPQHQEHHQTSSTHHHTSSTRPLRGS